MKPKLLIVPYRNPKMSEQHQPEGTCHPRAASGLVEVFKFTKTRLETLSESRDKYIRAVGSSLTTGRKWKPVEATQQVKAALWHTDIVWSR